jgi:NAD(P)H-quinone oxidoreductase subunit L
MIWTAAVALPGFLSTISTDTLLVLGAYVALAGAYLVVVPLVLIAWMSRRWTVMGKIERTGIYGLVFLFFPGLILFAPFINLRLQGQGEVA